MRVPWVVAFLPLLSGCLGDGANLEAALPSTAGGVPRPGDLPGIAGELERTPHYLIGGPTTIDLEVSKVEGEFTYEARLLHFLTTVKPGHFRFSGNPHLILFVPLSLETGVPACAEPPKGLRFRYGPLLQESDSGNLTGEYPAGWYHAIIAVKVPGSVRITFDASKDEKVRLDPGPSPFLSAQHLRFQDKRSYAETVPVSPTWFAWSHFSIGERIAGVTTTADLGREMTLSMDTGQPCAATRSVAQLPAGSSTSVTNTKRISLSAMGSAAPLDLKADYKPATDLAAPKAANLEIVWVSVKSPASEAPATS